MRCTYQGTLRLRTQLCARGVETTAYRRVNWYSLLRCKWIELTGRECRDNLCNARAKREAHACTCRSRSQSQAIISVEVERATTATAFHARTQNPTPSNAGRATKQQGSIEGRGNRRTHALRIRKHKIFRPFVPTRPSTDRRTMMLNANDMVARLVL